MKWSQGEEEEGDPHGRRREGVCLFVLAFLPRGALVFLRGRAEQKAKAAAWVELS